MSNLNFSFEKIKKNVFISIVATILFLCYLIYKIQTTQQFEISTNIPSTSQGEVAVLYKKSPFKNLRVTTSPDEMFSKAIFFVTTDSKSSEKETEEKLLKFLHDYYDSRAPYPDFKDPFSKALLKLKKETEESEKDLAQKLDHYAFAKKKYKSFQPLAFVDMEKDIINSEVAILVTHENVSEINQKKMSMNLIEIVQTTKISSLRNMGKTTLIKMILFFISVFFFLTVLTCFQSGTTYKATSVE